MEKLKSHETQMRLGKGRKGQARGYSPTLKFEMPSEVPRMHVFQKVKCVCFRRWAKKRQLSKVPFTCADAMLDQRASSSPAEEGQLAEVSCIARSFLPIICVSEKFLWDGGEL